MKGSIEVEIAPKGLTVQVTAAGSDAYRVMKALGHVEQPHPKQVRVVTMIVGPVVEQKL